MTKLGLFQTVEAPMTSEPPESDAVFAAKLADIGRKLDILKEGDGTDLQEHVDTVRKKLEAQRRVLLKRRAKHQEAYHNWIAEHAWSDDGR